MITETRPQTRRLTFTLPEFTRICWVSDRAREVWAPRVRRIIHAWTEVEWLTTRSQVRACASVRIDDAAVPEMQARWDAMDVSARELPSVSMASDARPAPSRAGQAAHPAMRSFVVGDRSCFDAFTRAWQTDDHDTLGALLGYPSCCRRAFAQRCLADGWSDPVWPMFEARASSPPGPSVVPRRMVQIDDTFSPLANIFWRRIGIRAMPHCPCTVECTDSLALARRYLDLGRDAGLSDEMTWLEEMLAWPVEWSALHGIAEVKTPVLRISARTDATADKLVLRWRGLTYPVEGAHGLAFPYVPAPNTIGRRMIALSQECH